MAAATTLGRAGRRLPLSWAALLLLCAQAASHDAQEALQDGVLDREALDTAGQYFRSRGAVHGALYLCRRQDQIMALRMASTGMDGHAVPIHFKRSATESVRRHEERHFTRVGVFVNISCPGAFQVLHDASRNHRFNSSYVWFLWGASPSLVDMVEGFNLAVDSEMVLAFAGPDGHVAMLQVSKIFYSMPLEVKPVVVGKAPSRRTDLTGLVVRVVGEAIRGTKIGWNQFPDYLEGFIRDADPGDIFKQGPRLFDLVRELYNFTFEMRTVAGGSSLHNNGSCIGIPGHLNRGDFDFALELWIDQPKLRCVQFIAYNLITYNPALVYRMPTRSSSATNSMITPFSPGSWAGVFIMFGTMALLLLIADEMGVEEAYGNFGPWSAALIFGTAGISWGSIHYGINSTALISVELGTVVGGLTYTIIFTYYQSSVVFGLLAKDTRPPLTVQEVIAKEYQIVSDDFAYFRNMFETSNDSDLVDIHQRFLTGGDSASGFVGLSTGARRVRNEHVALVGDEVAVAKQLSTIMTRQQLCTVRYTSINGDHSHLYSAARKDWPVSELIKSGLTLALERGLSRRIVRPFSPPCSSASGSSAHSQTTVSALQVSAATTAYLTLATGFSISGTLLVMEMLTPGLLQLYERLDAQRRLSTLFIRSRKASRVSREYVSRRVSRMSRVSRGSIMSRGRRASRSRPSRVILVEPATPTQPSAAPSTAPSAPPPLAPSAPPADATPLSVMGFFH